MIKLLVVDDSRIIRMYMSHLFGQEPDFEVVGTAEDGKEGVALAARLRPDVITMDINMPIMDGLEATRRIMEECPTPIVIVSASWDQAETNKTFGALEIGALACLQKPVGFGAGAGTGEIKELVQTVRLMSEVRVVRRTRPRKRQQMGELPGKLPVLTTERRPELLAIGASTGGPVALQQLLSRLPADFPLPVLAVQHIAVGFLAGMVGWLDGSTPLRVRLADADSTPTPGEVVFAPDGFHMGLGPEGRIRLSWDPPEHSVRPSVSHLFRTISESCPGRSIAVLLTGMGKDGALELKSLRDGGATTFAQDEESSVVHGMPGEAVRIGAASQVMAPAAIGETIVELVKGWERR